MVFETHNAGPRLYISLWASEDIYVIDSLSTPFFFFFFFFASIHTCSIVPLYALRVCTRHVPKSPPSNCIYYYHHCDAHLLYPWSLSLFLALINHRLPRLSLFLHLYYSWPTNDRFGSGARTRCCSLKLSAYFCDDLFYNKLYRCSFVELMTIIVLLLEFFFFCIVTIKKLSIITLPVCGISASLTRVQ